MNPLPSAPSLIQPSLLSRMNERQVLRAIQSHGPMSRAEVARYAGISAPTASKAVESLVRDGWLEEGDAPELVRGRPARKLRLPGRTAQVIGLVIDADQCRMVSAGLDGAVCDESHLFSTPDSYEALIVEAVAHAEKLMARPGIRTLGIGISMPGLIDYREQRGILSPNVPITNDHTPAADLSETLGIEGILVQESHALCLAERYYGNARGLDNFAMLDATSGVGLGVMSSGQLLTGHRGLAGEVGHITVIPDGRQCGCGNIGCLETVACDAAVAWTVSRRLDQRITVEELAAHLQHAPGLANVHFHSRRDDAEEYAKATRESLDRMTDYLAIGVAAVINLFNPSTLFIHSRLLGASDLLFDRMIASARRRALGPSIADCRIVQARGSKRQGAVAAIIEHLLSGMVPMQMKDTHYLGGPAIRSTGPSPEQLRGPELLGLKEELAS